MGLVLLLHEDAELRRRVSALLEHFHEVIEGKSAAEVQTKAEGRQPDVVLCSQALCRDALPPVVAASPHVGVLIIGDAVPEEVEAGDVGTLDAGLLDSEVGRAMFLLQIDRRAAPHWPVRRGEVRRPPGVRDTRGGRALLVGVSEAAQVLRQRVEQAGRSRLNLLLTGETGVGKTHVAQAVHSLMDDGASRPFVVVEPAALPSTLFESELFGHARGAFTNAVGEQMGAFEAAQGGTLFLEEIGDLSLPLQVKLLRAVETKVIRRLGDRRDITVDVRIIAATNRNLEQDIAEGRFREDLFQRLNEVRIHIPPLRERLGDVVLLLEHFLAELNPDLPTPYRISPAAADLLQGYNWPGNVRELRTLARRLVHDDGTPEVSVERLIPLLPARIDRGAESDLGPEQRIVVFSRRVYLDELKRRGFSIRQTARALGIPYATLHSRLKSLGLLEVLREHRAGDGT